MNISERIVMDIYPQDLGKRVSWEVQQERGDIQPALRQGVSPRTILVAMLASLCPALLGAVYGSFSIAIPFGFITLILLACYVLALTRVSAADAFLEKPVSDYEIQMARAKVGDTLIQSYLDLALFVVTLPATQDETANREVRDAITALGTALEALPPEQPVVTDDPAALRAEAQAQVENAQSESDAVIAASRRRRAESLLRRADTSARTLLLLRRNRALREEVGEQIEALGTSLTALQVGGRQSTPELSGLAASIHRVALEANAVTVARAEVDMLLSQPRIIAAGEPQEVRLSVGG